MSDEQKAFWEQARADEPKLDVASLLRVLETLKARGATNVPTALDPKADN